MIDNILIHIGYHKTGSTWLQQELFTSDSNIFEPFSRKNKGQSTIVKLLIKDLEGFLLSSFDDNYENIQKEIKYILSIPGKDFRNKIPVISSERISGNPHHGGFDANIVAVRIKKSFPKAKILVVIREQKSFLLSNYFQYIRMGGMSSLSKYLVTKYDGKRSFFSPNHINYLLLVNKYYQLFDKKNVLVLPYEMFKNEPETFIKHLEKFLNIEISINEDQYRRKWNTKEHPFVYYYSRFLNLFRKNTSVNKYFLFSNKYIEYIIDHFVKILSRVTPAKLDVMLTSRLRRLIEQFVADRYKISNRKLSRLIGIDLTKYGY